MPEADRIVITIEGILSPVVQAAFSARCLPSPMTVKCGILKEAQTGIIRKDLVYCTIWEHSCLFPMRATGHISFALVAYVVSYSPDEESSAGMS